LFGSASLRLFASTSGFPLSISDVRSVDFKRSDARDRYTGIGEVEAVEFGAVEPLNLVVLGRFGVHDLAVP
jgi:hypothetical protein